MTANRKNLLHEAQNIRKTLKDLSDPEINAAVMEVLKCYAPFHVSDDLESILMESQSENLELG